MENAKNKNRDKINMRTKIYLVSFCKKLDNKQVENNNKILSMMKITSSNIKMEDAKTKTNRTFYFYENENKGNRKYFTFGAGVQVKKLKFNFSYLIPQFQDHPLAETLRFGIIVDLSPKSDQ